MTEAEELARTAALFDTPHTQVGLQRDTIARSVGLDLAGCNVCTIVLALNEFDLERLQRAPHPDIEPMGHRFDTWPDAARTIFRRELAAFAERNKGVKIEAITQAIGGKPLAFILCLHWRPK